jgi:hypothetical protein
MAATGKLFLAVEIISRDDHHADTVCEKGNLRENPRAAPVDGGPALRQRGNLPQL